MSVQRNLSQFTHLAHKTLLLSSAICLLSLTVSSAITSAYAAPCFDTPKKAYDYLLATEKLAVQAQTQTGININRARESELTLLHGIGSSKAQAIILYRETFGDFKTVDELAKVKGIGAKTIEKNRSRLQVRE